MKQRVWERGKGVEMMKGEKEGEGEVTPRRKASAPLEAA